MWCAICICEVRACTHEDAVCGEGALKLPPLRVRLVLVLPALRFGLTCSPRVRFGRHPTAPHTGWWVEAGGTAEGKVQEREGRVAQVLERQLGQVLLLLLCSSCGGPQAIEQRAHHLAARLRLLRSRAGSEERHHAPRGLARMGGLPGRQHLRQLLGQAPLILVLALHRHPGLPQTTA
jgi:hypothetical protein